MAEIAGYVSTARSFVARLCPSEVFPTPRSPAMKAGIATMPMKIEDIVEMLPLPVAKKRGSYKPRKPKA